jgi:hypothetical protein
LAEEAVIDYEFAKVSYLTTDREKFLNRAQTLLREAKDAEKLYLLAVNCANSAQTIYIESGKMTLQNFQFLEEEFIDYSQNCLRKFFIFSSSGMKNILDDDQRMQKLIENISIEGDIDEYIRKNTTNMYPPDYIPYIPYKIAIRSTPIEQHPLSSESVFNVISTLQSTFEKIDGEPVNLLLYSLMY